MLVWDKHSEAAASGVDAARPSESPRNSVPERVLETWGSRVHKRVLRQTREGFARPSSPSLSSKDSR